MAELQAVLDGSRPWVVLQGDALARLCELPDQSVHCIVTSPPYLRQRQYAAGPQEIGQEATVGAWVEVLVAVFREAKRVLRDDGTLWVNCGASYGRGAHDGTGSPKQSSNPGANGAGPGKASDGNLLGLPWRLAFALQDDGWILRSELIWAKDSPMPESLDGWSWERHKVKTRAGRVTSGQQETGKNLWPPDVASYAARGLTASWTDCPGCAKCLPNDGLVLAKDSWRATLAHEQIFMFSKKMHYFGDREAMKEPGSRTSHGGGISHDYAVGAGRHDSSLYPALPAGPLGRNPRSVRHFASEPQDGRYGARHFASFPTSLPAWCIRGSTSERGVCSLCGAPWARVVEHTMVGSYHDHSADGVEYGLRQNGGGPANEHEPDRTLGWRATCRCKDAGEPIGAVVLDPFVGSGSTGIAAVRMGRRFIGIDLSTRYVALSKRRIMAEAAQGNTVLVAKEAPGRRSWRCGRRAGR